MLIFITQDLYTNFLETIVFEDVRTFLLKSNWRKSKTYMGILNRGGRLAQLLLFNLFYSFGGKYIDKMISSSPCPNQVKIKEISNAALSGARYKQCNHEESLA